LTRTKNTFRNLIWALLGQVIVLGFGFVMPRLIILTYGSAINGLTATIYQILNVLNLLQAGALGASIFALFKPVADGDYKQISLILDSSRRYFNKLGWFFLLLMFVIAPIVASNNEGSGISFLEIFLAFAILGLNASFSFFFYSRYDILFSADQKRYILSITSIVEKLIYYSLLFIILRYKIDFIYMYVAVLIGSSIKVILLYLIYIKQYANKIVAIDKDEYFEIPNKRYLLINQISTQAVESSPTLFIAFNFNFKLASVYSIYYLIILMIKMVINTVQVSVSEVFGNMVVSEDSKKIENVFDLMLFIYIVLGVFLTTCTAFLFMPFISLYTKGMTDVDYIIPLLAFFIVIYSLVFCLYMPFFTLSNVYGLYKETYLQSLITGIIALIISFAFTKYIEMSFVLTGLIFYYLVSMIYRIIIITKRIDWFTVKNLTSRLLLYITLPLSAFYIQQAFLYSISSWGMFFGIAIITGTATMIFITLYMLVFEKKMFFELKEYAKKSLKR
jgi:O-antigen/teichoic acid export membrane protein